MLQQFVKLGDIGSNMIQISLGVPQGSVLGPLLFFIFINDLTYFLPNSCTKMFANDTTIYISDINIEKLITAFKKELLLLLDWCHHNLMEINWTKTYFMFINYDKKAIIPTDITIDNIKNFIISNY